MPAINQLSHEQQLDPARLAEVYVSIGPGSFTGLRIAIATAKMLALTNGVKLVAVPTLDAMIHRVPKFDDDGNPTPQHVIACLNLKHDTAWARRFARDADGEWQPTDEPSLRTADALLDDTRHGRSPVGLLGDPLPDLPDAVAAVCTALPAAWARPLAHDVFAIGARQADQGAFTDEPSLLPLYAREPEAVSLWKARHG